MKPNTILFSFFPPCRTWSQATKNFGCFGKNGEKVIPRKVFLSSGKFPSGRTVPFEFYPELAVKIPIRNDRHSLRRLTALWPKHACSLLYLHMQMQMQIRVLDVSTKQRHSLLPYAPSVLMCVLCA